MKTKSMVCNFFSRVLACTSTSMPDPESGLAKINRSAHSKFRGFVLSILFVSLGSLNLFSQIYEMDLIDGQTVSTCSGNFYDSGGAGLSYAGNENFTGTFCAPAGSTYDFFFSSFSLRSGDTLFIYDGPTIASSLIGAYSEFSLNGVTISSTGSCLTFRFKSDGSFIRPGWNANIACNSCPSIAAPVITPSGSEACAGETIIYSVDMHAGSIYNWTITEGTPVSVMGGTNTLSVTWDLPGLVTGIVKVEEVSLCGSSASSELYVDIYPAPSPVISGLADVCPNTSGEIYSTPLVPGNAYNWNVSGGTFLPALNTVTINWGATGPGTITVTETDPGTGCSTISSVYTVLIQDVVAPVISGCPANIVINTLPGTCANTATWVEPVATDVCNGVVPFISRSHAPGSSFNEGVNTVTYTFTDGAGNTSVCTFTVTVNDTEVPNALCKNITVQLDLSGNAVITGADVDNGSTDNCGVASLSVVPSAFNNTNLGLNNVVLTVTDVNGNISTCNAVVNVVPNTPPIALCKNITVFLGPGGSVTITGADVDNGSSDPDGIASLTVAPNVFDCTDIGANAVVLTVTDNAGQSSTCNATVTVADNIAPTLICPADIITGTSPGICGAIVNYLTPVGVDNCSGSITTQTAGLPSGSTFPVGNTLNTFLVTDASGNTATCSFNVSVTDNEAPVITLPVPPIVNAGAGCQAAIPAIAAAYSDNCTASGSIIKTQVPAPGTMVGTGVTIVTLTAQDLAGNISTTNINVTVVDAAPPVITPPVNVSANVGPTCQATVPNFLAALVVTDDCTAPGSIIKTQVPAAGTTVTGTTTTNITIEATDASGNKSSVVVLFITNDIIAPVAVCQNTTIYLDGAGSATLSPLAINNGSTDNCTMPVNLTLSRSIFNCSDVGAAVSVTLTVRDNSLNTATCNALVTVLDTIKPTVNVKTHNLIIGASGTATLLPADVNNGSFDNCGPLTYSVAPNTFVCGDQGSQTVTLTVTDASGNSRSKSVNITVSSDLNIDAISLSSCNLAGPFAHYTSIVSGGNGTYSYFWDGLEDAVDPFIWFDIIAPFIHFSNTSTQQAPFFNNLMPDGIYNIQHVVTDGNGCVDTAVMVLNKDAGLIFNNVTIQNSTACENEIKTYSVAAGATSYLWSIENGVFLTPTNTNSVTVQWSSLPSGVLIASITQPNLFGDPCTSSVVDSVTINTLPLPSFNSPALVACENEEVTYTLNSSFTTHAWSVVNGTITLGGGAADNFARIRWNAFPAGTVSVAVTNASGCSDNASANVTINPLPVATLSSSDADNTFCAGTSITFTAGGGSTYDFRVNGASVQNGPLNTYTTTSLTNGQTVDVRVTSASSCSAVSAVITNTVTSFPAPNLTSSDADNSFCAGTSVTFTASGGTTFDFRINGVSVQAGGSATFTTSALTNGQVVDVIVTNAGGCSAAAPGITNTVLAAPLGTLGSSDADNTFCTGTSITFTAGGGTLYNFRINGISVQNGASNTYVTAGLTNGQIVDVIVSNAGGCTNVPPSITNTVTPLPVPTLLSSDADNIICAGTSVTFTAGGGTSYAFRVNGATVQSGAGTTYTTSGLTNGQVVDVIVSNAGGCSATSASFVMTVTPLPTASISYVGSPFCSNAAPGQPVTLIGTPGGTYTSLPAGLTINAVSGAINPVTSTPGLYTVTYTIAAAGGCGPVTATAPVTITQLPVATFTYPAPSYCTSGADPSPVFGGGGVAGTFSAAPAGLVFISTATGQIDLSASSAGTYTVTNTIAAGGGCAIVTSNTVVTIILQPTALISYSGSPYCTSVAIPQAVTLTGTGLYTGGTFSSTPGLTINAGSGAVTPSSSTPGTYTVTYNLPAAGGCSPVSVTASVTITAAPSATIAYGGSPYCTSVVTPQAVTFAGTAGGTFTALPGGLSINAATGAITPSASATGAYTVTYSIPASGGCSAFSTTAPVTITAAPTAFITYIGAPFCSSAAGNRNVFLSGTGAFAGGSYTSSPAGLTLNASTGAITPSTSVTGTYTVTYTTLASGGCLPVSTNTSVTITPLPSASISYTGAPFCNTVIAPQPVTLTGTSGGIFTALPAGLTIDAVTGAVTPSTSLPGPYTVTYTILAAGGCGIVTASTNVTITEFPTVSILYSGDPFCISLGTPQNVTINGTGDYLGGLFSSTAGLSINSTTGSILPSSSSAGNYIVTYQTVPSGGCLSVSATDNITIAPLPVPTITGPATACQTVAGNIYTTEAGMTGYIWVVTGGTVNSGGSATDNTVSVTWNTSGVQSLSVNYTSLAGCAGASPTTYNVTVTPVNTITLTSAVATANQNVCINSPVTNITYATTGATNATFSGLPAGVSGIWASNVVTISGTPSVAGNFTYTVTLTGGCGTVSTTGVINVNTLPNIIITNPPAYCIPGTANLTAPAVTSGSDPLLIFTYWTNALATIPLAAPNAVTAGTYYIKGTNPSGCYDIKPVTVTGVTPPTGSTSVTNVLCSGQLTGAVNLTVSGGTAPFTYLWSNGAVTEDLTGVAAGTYNVVITDANGCTAAASGTVTQPLLPLAGSTSVTNVVCFGQLTGGVDLTVAGGTAPYTYLWSNGATTQDLAGVAAGTYNVLITDANGCTEPESAIVTQPLAAIAGSTAVTNVVCFGQSTGAVNLTVTGGTAPFSYLWSNGAITEDLSGVAAGTYNVTITDANGCTAVASGTVNQPAVPFTASAIATNVLCFGGTGAVDLTVSGGTGPFTYLWSNGAITQDLAGVNAGTYNVTVTDAALCTATASATVTAPAIIAGTTIVTNVQCNGDNTGIVDLTVSGGVAPYTYLWSNGATTQDLMGVIAGTYTVTITDANGCTSGASGTISEPLALTGSTAITDVACNGQATGSIVLTVTGGVAPYSYLWTNGAITKDITGLTSGSYTVIITDSNLCTTIATATVSQPTSLTATATGTDVLCNGGLTGSVTLTVSGGTVPYSYLWSNGATTKDINSLAAGTYSVIITDFLGCTAAASAVISEPLAINGTTIITDASCNGASNGAVNLTVTGGIAPYTYLWSNGAVTEDLIAVTSGTYSVTISDANSCTSVVSATVGEPGSITTSTAVTDIKCNGGITGIINLTVIGGTAPYTYLWSNGATTEDLAGVAAGTYNVTINDAAGCSVITSATVTEPLVLSGSTIATDVLCNGQLTGAVTLTVTGGIAPYTFLWSNGAVTKDLAGVAAGAYSVVITDANLCTANASATVNEPVLLAGSTTVTNVLCFGGLTGGVDLTVAGGTGPYTYLWSNGATTQDLTNVAAGTYTVTITDANSCTANASGTVTEPAAALIGSTTVTNVLCFGGVAGGVDLTVAGGTGPYTYLWSNGATTQDLTNVAAGTYTVTITDASSCTANASGTVTEPAAALIGSTTVTNVLCFGGLTGGVDLTVAGGTGPYTYLWSNGATTQDLTNVAAGTYTVTITDSNSCTANASGTVTEPAAALIGSTTVTNVLCFGGLTGGVDLTVAGGTGPFTYLWSNGATNQDLTNVAAGTYTVTITDANSCTANASGTVTEPAAALIGSTTVTNVLCFGGVAGGVDLTVAGGTGPYTYLWSNGATTQDLTNVAAGTYTVTITDANSCTANASGTVSEPTTLAGSTLVTDVLCNGQLNGAVTLTVTGGVAPYSYLWSNGAVTKDLAGVAVGTYSVVITDANLCTANASATIAGPALLSGSTAVTDVTCNGGSTGNVILTVTGGTLPYTYLWSNGATTSNLNGVTAGTYTVTITDFNGCTAVATGIVNEPLPITATTVVTDVLCGGFTTGAVNLTVSGGVAPYTYLWSNGAITEDLAGVAAGTYNVTIIDASGCSAIASATVSEPPVLSSSALATDVLCFGQSTGGVTLTVTGGVAPYTYLWSNGAVTKDLTGLAAGSYSVVITDANLCTSNASASVSEPVLLSGSTAVTDVTCNGGSTGNVILTVSGGTLPYTYLWSNGATTSNLNGVTAGTYTVTITDFNGCTAVATGIVNEPLPITATTVVTDASCGGFTDGAIDLTVLGGVAPYTYLWSNGAIGEDLTSLAAGLYSVTITDANLCTATVSATVNSPSGISVTTAVTDPTCNGGSDGAVAITVSGGIAPYTFLWSNGATTEDITGITAGVYSVTITDGVGCSTVATGTVTDPPAIIGTTVTSDVLCTGASTGGVVLTVMGGTAPYTYLWSNGAITQDLSGVVAGTYSVTITDANTCTGTASATINEPLLALSGSISAQTNVSVIGGSDGSVTVDGIGGTPAYQYKLDAGAYQPSGTFGGLMAGSYTVTVQDANLCTFDVPVTITQPGLPLSGSIVSQTDVLCFGLLTGSVTVTGIDGQTPYEYSLDGGTYQVSGTFGSLGAGSYIITVRDAASATFVIPVTITEPTDLTVSTTQTDVICSGGSTGTATAIPAGGIGPYTYSWSTTPAQTNSIATGLTDGNYTVTVTDANGCTASATITIAEPAPLSVVMSSTDNACNGGITGTATAAPSGGTAPYTYSWNTIPVQTTSTAIGLAAGSYTVTITDANGCSLTGNVSVGQPTALSLAFTPREARCPDSNDGELDLLITGGTPPYSVIWNDGATTQNLTNILPGTYSVVVTDANGCAVSGSSEVTFIGTFDCVVIPGVITPDPADGYNDEWVIRNIDLYPNAEVRIFTRWGKMIYKTKNISANPWNGRYSNGRLVPTDSYHYILYLGDGTEPRSGVISVIRR